MIRNKKNTSGHHPVQKAEEKGHRILISKDGPYLVSGGLPLARDIIIADAEGVSVEWGKGAPFPDQETYSLCRCGGSKGKPFCDGTHARTGFDGTETAGKKKYLPQAERIDGPGYVLTDVPSLCSLARFCHQAGGIWQLTEGSDDPKTKDLAARIAGQCPSGRLVVWDAETGKPIEPDLEPSIGVVEDPEEGVSGPLYVKGGVPVESQNGTRYEVRNRVTLCRCGKSENKPYCDGSHIDHGFNDGDPSLRQ